MNKNELYHHGIKGQKWGERNYQYEDGSLTPAGKIRYNDNTSKLTKTHTYSREDMKLRSKSVSSTGEKESRVSRMHTISDDHKKLVSERTKHDTKTLVSGASKDLNDWISKNPNANVSWLTASESDTDDIREYLEEALGINGDDLPDEQVEEIRRDLLKEFDITTPEKQRKKKEEELDKMADAVIRGDFGNGDERKNRLGSDYEEVQKRVNKKLQHSAIDDILEHHGIRGQKWGDRNGPPYPLGGGDYSPREVSKIKEARKSHHNIYNKRHFDQVIKKGTVAATLSYNKDRTKDTDMFYAAHTKADKDQYNALFNKKAPTPIYDQNGNEVGTAQFYKYRINNVALNDIKVASEDSAADVFMNLYSKDRDFYNFVTDQSRMQGHFVEDKYKFRGYRESRESLEKLRSGEKPSADDMQRIYRMFNYVLPSDGAGNSRAKHDIELQRAKFFKELKKEGYGALLDTNDAIYGGFKAQSPVIMFDMEQIALKDANRVTTASKYYSDMAFVGRKALGII